MAVVVVLALAILAPSAFAAVTGNQGNADWFNKMFDYRKQWVNQAVDKGQLTQEQGQAWSQHFYQMKKFHDQNGYYCPGFGGGMMSGFGSPVPNNSN